MTLVEIEANQIWRGKAKGSKAKIRILRVSLDRHQVTFERLEGAPDHALHKEVRVAPPAPGAVGTVTPHAYKPPAPCVWCRGKGKRYVGGDALGYYEMDKPCEHCRGTGRATRRSKRKKKL